MERSTFYWKEKHEQERRLKLFNKLYIAGKMHPTIDVNLYIQKHIDFKDFMAFVNDYTIENDRVVVKPRISNNMFRQSYIGQGCGDFPGLYFIGDIKYDPLYGKMFYVKIGSSSNVGKRLKQYRTYNPAFYHDCCSLRIARYKKAETYCHNYLYSRCKFMPVYTAEWFIVDEETYWDLCRIFSNDETFRAIAEGRD